MQSVRVIVPPLIAALITSNYNVFGCYSPTSLVVEFTRTTWPTLIAVTCNEFSPTPSYLNVFNQTVGVIPSVFTHNIKFRLLFVMNSQANHLKKLQSSIM